MCIALLIEGIETEEIKMTKSIKISETAHKALEFAKVMEGIKIGEYASTALIEAIQKDYPEAYQALKKKLTTEKQKKQVTTEKS